MAEAKCDEIARWLASTVLAFLDAHLRLEPLAIAWLASDNVVAASGGVAEFQRK